MAGAGPLGAAVLRDQARPSGVQSTQVWFGPEARPLYGWVTRPANGLASGGVILCPPMGEEGRAAHRTLRRLGEELAAAGILALRFDYDGTGDSAGLQDDPDRVAGWLASIEAAREHLLELGAPSVAAVGMRLGATMAAVQAAARGSGQGAFSALVCWDPCLSGRTFLREGEALYAFGEDSPGEAPEDGYRHTPGFQYDAATAKGLRDLDLGRLPQGVKVADRLLLLTRTDRPAQSVIGERLSAATESFEERPAIAQDRLLDLPPSACFVPEEALAGVLSWLCDTMAGQREVPVKSPGPERSVLLASLDPGSPQVRERSVRIGPAGLYGIVDEPIVSPERTELGPRAWVVLVNVAAEHHIGPGRRWPEFARRWAAMGYRVVRIDQSGVGDSPTRPGQLEDEPFAPEWIDDMRELIADLGTGLGTDLGTGSGTGSGTDRGVGRARIAMVGLCSGAYSSFEAALWADVDAVFAANPRLTLFPAAKNTPNFTRERRAGMVPNRPFAVLAVRHRIFAGGLWRIYREVAIWHAPLLVLWRVARRRTAIEVVACHDDAQHFKEVYLLRPLLWILLRNKRFRFREDDVYDHSLLGSRGQDVMFERATEFLDTYVGPAPGATVRPDVMTPRAAS